MQEIETVHLGRVTEEIRPTLRGLLVDLVPPEELRSDAGGNHPTTLSPLGERYVPAVVVWIP